MPYSGKSLIGLLPTLAYFLRLPLRARCAPDQQRKRAMTRRELFILTLMAALIFVAIIGPFVTPITN
jgi:hypothetical protein